LIGCVSAALALTGCSRPATPRFEYQRKTAAICADTVHQVRALPAPRSDAEIVTVVRRLRTINRHMTQRIAVLDPPPGDRPERRQDGIVDSGLRTDGVARELLEALTRSSQPRHELERRRPALRRAAIRESHAWAKGRLRSCADGPSRALAEVGARAPAPTRAAPPA
jgi:hypothetical protein